MNDLRNLAELLENLVAETTDNERRFMEWWATGTKGVRFPARFRFFVSHREALLAAQAALATPPAADDADLGAAWRECVAALPEGWLFHGVGLVDHSMEGGSWGPDWVGQASWPEHCEYDDCDHDEAFRDGYGPTPTAALRALTARLRDGAPE